MNNSISTLKHLNLGSPLLYSTVRDWMYDPVVIKDILRTCGDLVGSQSIGMYLPFAFVLSGEEDRFLELSDYLTLHEILQLFTNRTAKPDWPELDELLAATLRRRFNKEPQLRGWDAPDTLFLLSNSESLPFTQIIRAPLVSMGIGGGAMRTKSGLHTNDLSGAFRFIAKAQDAIRIRSVTTYISLPDISLTLKRSNLKPLFQHMGWNHKYCMLTQAMRDYEHRLSLIVQWNTTARRVVFGILMIPTRRPRDYIELYNRENDYVRKDFRGKGYPIVAQHGLHGWYLPLAVSSNKIESVDTVYTGVDTVYTGN